MSITRVVARIGKPHGLRGEVTVQVHTDDPDARFVIGGVLETEAATGSGVPKALTIASVRVHQGIWLLGFEEIPDRTGAESLRGTRLVIDDESDSAGSDADDEAFAEDDLIGLTVLDPSGVAIGEVRGLELGSAQDRLVVRLTDGREGAVPFVHALVPVVDLEAGTVVVDAPAGLFDLAD